MDPITASLNLRRPPLLAPGELAKASLDDAGTRLQAWIDYENALRDLYQEKLVLVGIEPDLALEIQIEIDDLEARFVNAGRIVSQCLNRYKRELHQFDKLIPRNPGGLP